MPSINEQPSQVVMTSQTDGIETQQPVSLFIPIFTWHISCPQTPDSSHLIAYSLSQQAIAPEMTTDISMRGGESAGCDCAYPSSRQCDTSEFIA